MDFISNLQLTFAMRQHYPDTANGQDYLIGHPVNERGEHCGHAFFMRWNRDDLKQPDEAGIHEIWARYQPLFDSTLATNKARADRDALLTEADHLVNRAADNGDAEREQALRRYRQALRDVPQQRGFPNDIEWPNVPEESQ